MGNRATVIFTDDKETEIGPAVYLHWNGGPESIYAFLDEMDRRKCRCADLEYETACFVHVVADFFDDNDTGCRASSVGVRNGPPAITPEGLSAFDPGDNGVYVVHRERGKAPRVRRFEATHYGELPVEFSKKRVAQERKESQRHYYNTGVTPEASTAVAAADSKIKRQTISECFLKIRPKVGEYG